jgi:imidazoleglycerol phosphate synthase glutamine amidotransferase subunit HisH
MIAVIDYKAGNLTSVVKALRYLGADDILVTQAPADVLRASKIVLPGVGHFRATQLLEYLGLTKATRAAIANGTPFLGICVGLQWLYEGSTEAPETPGLGHFSGQCERFPATFEGNDLKSPHVGSKTSAPTPACSAASRRAASSTTRTPGARPSPQTPRPPRSTAERSPPPLSATTLWECSFTPRNPPRPASRS